MSTTYKRPKPCGASAEEISIFAEKIANYYNVQPGNDLEPVVLKQLNGEITYLPFTKTSTKQASIIVEKGGKFIIQLSPFLFPLQRRISIAHELGHFFLHSRYGEVAIKAYHNAEQRNELVEEEAYEFACGFLMPQEEFYKIAKDSNNDSIKVATYFMVPEPVARQRLINLGCR